jgi:cyclopropane fatty-acyl-phospholipid synthase-like methyltransferase
MSGGIMKNKNVTSYYDKMAEKITNPKDTRNKAKDFSKYDIEFMKKMSNPNKNLLDLGAGTGLLVNHLVSDFKRIIAVEKYQEFSRFITQSNNIKIINADLLDFTIDCCFDFVSLFGVMNYFNKEEAISIYENAFSFLKKGGKIIVKNQMGIYDDVIVDGYSEELKTNYYAEYRAVDKEIELLKLLSFNKIEKVDIYPPEYNRWDNTHFYALVGEK